MADQTQILRIRMYRVGFGDCFLLTLPVAGGVKHILIDCGVHPGGDTGVMEKAVANIAKETDRKLALVIVTHNHKDHVSGFGKCRAEWEKFEVDHVWLPWTENPADPEAVELRQKQLAVAAAVERHLAVTQLAASRAAAQGVLDLIGANETAMGLLQSGFNGGKVRYLTAGMTLEDIAGIPGLTAQILAPPHDAKFLARMNPPASERFLRAAGEEESEDFPELRPFGTCWVVDQAKWPHYAALSEKQKNLLAVAATNAEGLAFALDDALNNTSIVSHIGYGGKKLLFAGDAQYGNWQSWIGTTEAKQILATTDFFKVAHHGSENATPKSVVEGLRHKGYAVMIPTQTKPWRSIPDEKLITAVMEKASAAVRSDSLPIAGTPEGPKLAKLPKGFTQGEFWYDYSLPVRLG